MEELNNRALPKNLEDLFVRFAFFSQGDVHWILTGCLLQILSHFVANQLDLLMQEGILFLQFLTAVLHLRHLLLLYEKIQKSEKQVYLLNEKRGHSMIWCMFRLQVQGIM